MWKRTRVIMDYPSWTAAVEEYMHMSLVSLKFQHYLQAVATVYSLRENTQEKSSCQEAGGYAFHVTTKITRAALTRYVHIGRQSYAGYF
jgi:hypothetical protein